MARDSAASLAPVEYTSTKRIPAGLAESEKVAALVDKAGARGITKSGLIQGIRLKPKADALASILDELAAEGRVEVKDVRVGGSSRIAPRYFSAEAVGAA